MAQIYIGTSGYSYDDWKGSFYPRTLNSSGFLNYYAEHFPFVELNFSYYRQPDPEMIIRMAERTPENFLFTVKAHQSLTHNPSSDWKKDADVYIRGIQPLVDTHRLGAILLQFPYSFHRNRANRLYLASLCDTLESFPLAVEFRNSEWQNEDVYTELSRRNIGYVHTDSPDLKGLPAAGAETTSAVGYIRFHGRNRENWWAGDNVSRYDYLYTVREMEEWLERIREIIKKATILFVAFNNHHKGQAVENAFQFARLLREKKFPVIPPGDTPGK